MKGGSGNRGKGEGWSREGKRKACDNAGGSGAPRALVVGCVGVCWQDAGWAPWSYRTRRHVGEDYTLVVYSATRTLGKRGGGQARNAAGDGGSKGCLVTGKRAPGAWGHMQSCKHFASWDGQPERLRSS